MRRKTLLITGCSSGIGLHCAHAAKADGWHVLATARKAADVAMLQEQGFDAFLLDYTDYNSLAAAVKWALSTAAGPLDAVFQNGAYAQPGAVEDLPTEALRTQFETNVFGWHELNRHLIPIMRKQGHGRLVFCSSILGVAPVPWRGAYSASKFAIEGLMLTLRQELSGSGIEIAMIEPGPIVSKIAPNGLVHFKAHVDIESSVHAAAYKAQLQRMEQGGSNGKYKLGPEAVYKALHHALESKNPQVHYPVTLPARMGFFMRRFVPFKTFYRLLAKGA